MNFTEWQPIPEWLQEQVDKKFAAFTELENRVKLLELEIKSLKQSEITIDPIMVTNELKAETQRTLKEALKPGGMLWSAMNQR